MTSLFLFLDFENLNRALARGDPILDFNKYLRKKFSIFVYSIVCLGLQLLSMKISKINSCIYQNSSKFNLLLSLHFLMSFQKLIVSQSLCIE